MTGLGETKMGDGDGDGTKMGDGDGTTMGEGLGTTTAPGGWPGGQEEVGWCLKSALAVPYSFVNH